MNVTEINEKSGLSQLSSGDPQTTAVDGEPAHMIRSVQFITKFYPYVDGVVQTAHNYALNLNAALVCPRMTKDLDVSQFPYKVLLCPALRFPKLKCAAAIPALKRSLMKEIEAQRPEILHAHDPAMLGRLALKAGKRLGIPVVGTFHSKIYDSILEFTRSKLIARAVTRMAVKFYESCDAVWACSEGTAETLRSYGYHGDITVMTNGTDFSFPADPERLKATAAQHFAIPKGKHILLFVGQMVWYKNQRLILDTYKLLTDESDDYCLIFAGDGKSETGIKDYAASLGLKNSVIFTGKISDNRMLSGLYLNADLFFFPSVFDNTPLVLREAAALEVPTLAAEGSNTAESICKDKNGFTAPADASSMCAEIKRIFANTQMRRAAGKSARETIPVSWQALIPQVQLRYREIIAAYNKRPQ